MNRNILVSESHKLLRLSAKKGKSLLSAYQICGQRLYNIQYGHFGTDAAAQAAARRRRNGEVFHQLSFNIKQVYPVLVVATVSSGKSTLINALAGTELLPNGNLPCTARAAAILDNDGKPQFVMHAIAGDGSYSLYENEKLLPRVIGEFNNGSDDIREMLIEGDIRGIRNNNRSLLLIDTPGVNNCLDPVHRTVTESVLKDYPDGLIIYIINMQQIGTKDDSAFLSYIADKLRENDRYRILFAVNKMDLIDPEREDPAELMENCRKYIAAKGIHDPVLLPISAKSALLFKKALAGAEMTEFDKEELRKSYGFFKRGGFSLQDYMYSPQCGDLRKTVSAAGTEYSRAQIMAALENTGLPLLERTVEEMLISSLAVRPLRIRAARGRRQPAEKNKREKRGRKNNR